MGGFKLTKWLSTSQVVMETVPQEERAKEITNLCLTNVENRVLGMIWHIKEDVFRLEVNAEAKLLTRRFILSITNRLFDPLGLVAPVIVEARLIFRDVCKQKIDWDDPVSQPYASRWKSWMDSLEGLSRIVIPRCFKSFDTKVNNLQLHVFVNALVVAPGAVCYLRVEYDNNLVSSSIVISKAHLASSENMTIPRMELEAAVDAVKLALLVKDEFELACSCTHWTDSAIVLQSIQAECKRFPVFARNRLAQIERNTCVYDWRHVPSEINPADLISRGTRANNLVDKRIWFEGPKFLKFPPERWPKCFSKEIDGDEAMLESFATGKGNVSFLACVGAGVNRLIDYFSSFRRLLVATAWLLRVKVCLSERLNGSDCDLSLSAVTVAELKDAELNLVRYVQKLCFSDAYRSMSCGSRRPILKSSPLYRSSPIMIDRVLRVGGRLNRAYLDFDVKHPIILPTDHHLTELIIEDVHSRIVGHLGVEATLNQICKRFWFSHAKTIIHRVLRKCVICKRRDARPYTQIMAELPLARLKIHEAPFSQTGVDYFGPLLVKQGRGTRKRYGCLFTCLTTRAIHLKVAIDLTTSAFINCFRRFIARRVPVKHMFSDNATNFVGCNREFREAVGEWNKHQIHTAL